ncbi:acyl-CoA thioesterase [[Actinomadura] parvosata]|uniref:acyl-CoA thioesterase n=1 Tax=[Actinomadura] parvosata TaxID=1955412 RepID=UPI001FEA7E97
MTISTPGRTVPVRVHFDELDPWGMLHHSRYAVLLDRAILTFWSEHGADIDPSRSAFKGAMGVVRDLAITYRAPISGICELAVCFWVESVGRSSVVYGFKLLSSDLSVLHAEGRRVDVNIDPGTLTSAPLSEAAREVLMTLHEAPPPH